MDPTLIVCSPFGGAWPTGFRKSQCVSCLQDVWLKNLVQRGLVPICPSCLRTTLDSRELTVLNQRVRWLRDQGKILWATPGVEG